MCTAVLDSVDGVLDALEDESYIADRNLATSLFLALKLHRPLFLEGAAGVGKTELAKVLAKVLGAPLVRLQCYEGLDLHTAVYEWNYARQILQIRLAEALDNQDQDVILHEIFGPEYLIRRPLLQAIDPAHETVPVLLIDELDRADEEFEAFLLELLSDFQVTIPEIGTIKAEKPPVVVITSNRTREIHDALKRRCLYHWIEYPSREKELKIVRAKVGDVPQKLVREVVTFVQELRELDLYKQPGISETLDWCRALMMLDQQQLDHEVVESTLGSLLKYRDDLVRVSGNESARILNSARAEAPAGRT